jgi:transcription-repair coupling factor (superfamily II helicase)
MKITEFGVPPAAWAIRCLELLDSAGPHLLVVAEDRDVEQLCADLQALAPERLVHAFRDDEQSPYSPLTPDPRRSWSRLGLLARLSMGDEVDLIVASAGAIGRSVPDLASVSATSLLLAPGEQSDREELVSHLEAAGYHHVPLVEDPGTVALRGSVVDLWPPGEKQPVRADFFGDELESLRFFDPVSQRQGRNLQLLVAAPARAFSVGPSIARAQRADLLALSDELQLPSATFMATWQRLEAGIRYPGVEALEPFLRPASSNLLSLLPRSGKVVFCAPARLEAALVDCDRLLLEGFEARRESELVAQPSAHRLDRDAVMAALVGRQRIDLESASPPDDERPRFDDLDDLQRQLASASRRSLSESADLLAPLVEVIRHWREQHFTLLILSENKLRQERLAVQLGERQMNSRTLPGQAPIGAGQSLDNLRDPKVMAYLAQGSIHRGWVDRKRLLVVMPERLISGRKKNVRSHRPTHFNTTLSELCPGKNVVHLDFGIGRYEGIERRVIDGIEHDFIRVDFRDNDKVFVPVARIGVLRPYDGSDQAKLDKIGGSSWQKRCARVRKGLLQIAHRLVETQAKREAFETRPLADAGEMARGFEQLFPFEPTPDQETAFEAIAGDLASPKPMDRLLCGDVGFGKTEVAMRAAFTAVAAGQQVAVLVPTTVLCQQHLRSFRERFEAVGARVAGLSRLVGAAQTKEVLKDLATGKIDVVIGTHKLLGRQVQFASLSLLIVDEEQRFGVRHKERIKELCEGVNVLTMTATPIPRTMQLAMLGVRKLSLIATPPADRRAVRTTVCRYEDELVREVVQREFERGGQVFFLHNRVQDLDAVAGHLAQLIPEARIAIAHGQMSAEAADSAMIGFIQGQTNLLVCTTIIESGLDIPNANTILIHRADRFGLAQLHQIRGRVGRRRERGYCYLLLRQDEDHLSDKAQQRLEALRRFTELGSGIRIAREDLDLRGAGNLIGSDQSGHIEAIGIDLYSELLREAIARVKGGQINSLANVDVKVGRPALVPRSFMPDAAERISLYDRLARAGEDLGIRQLEEELEDRYGHLPDEVEALFLCAQARWRAGAAGVSELVSRFNGEGEHRQAILAATFEAGKTSIDPSRLVAWVDERKAQARLTANGRLIWQPTKRFVEGCSEDPAKLLLRFAEELRLLAQPAA